MVTAAVLLFMVAAVATAALIQRSITGGQREARQEVFAYEIRENVAGTRDWETRRIVELAERVCNGESMWVVALLETQGMDTVPAVMFVAVSEKEYC